MFDIEKARHLFQDPGLTFPNIPEELAARLKERSEWVFSTRKIVMSPYNLQHYPTESEEAQVEDYLVLAHSGQGVNSYAIQYYLVQGSLRMFLPKAVRVGSGLNDVSLVGDPIQQGFAEPGIGDHLRPF